MWQTIRERTGRDEIENGTHHTSWNGKWSKLSQWWKEKKQETNQIKKA